MLNSGSYLPNTAIIIFCCCSSFNRALLSSRKFTILHSFQKLEHLKIVSKVPQPFYHMHPKWNIKGACKLTAICNIGLHTCRCYIAQVPDTISTLYLLTVRSFILIYFYFLAWLILHWDYDLVGLFTNIIYCFLLSVQFILGSAWMHFYEMMIIDFLLFLAINIFEAQINWFSLPQNVPASESSFTRSPWQSMVVAYTSWLSIENYLNDCIFCVHTLWQWRKWLNYDDAPF